MNGVESVKRIGC